jgi:Stress responsive A/B Barrel Domain
MITHIVLLQPKTEVTDEEITTALEHVGALQKEISGIIDVQTGKNMSNYNQGYTHGFVMHFVDAEHLKAYASHPAHQRVSKELQQISQKIIDFDIEQDLPNMSKVRETQRNG